MLVLENVSVNYDSNRRERRGQNDDSADDYRIAQPEKRARDV